MFPGPTDLLLTGYSTELIWTPRSKSGTSTPEPNAQTFSRIDTSHVMNGTTFCVCFIPSFSALKAALKPWRRGCRKVIMKKRIVDKSKPVRNLVSRSRAGISTVPSSTASSSPGIFGLEDREVSFKASMEQPVVQHQEKRSH